MMNNSKHSFINNCHDVFTIQSYDTIDNIDFEPSTIDCDYIDNNGFSIIHLNACSLKCNYNDVIHFIDSINNHFDVIVITEIWLNEHNHKLVNNIIIIILIPYPED